MARLEWVRQTESIMASLRAPDRQLRWSAARMIHTPLEGVKNRLCICMWLLADAAVTQADWIR
jgi:hypothetical protein